MAATAEALNWPAWQMEPKRVVTRDEAYEMYRAQDPGRRSVKALL